VKPEAKEQVKPQAKEQAPKEQAPKEQAPKDQAPKEQAPKEQAPKEHKKKKEHKKHHKHEHKAGKEHKKHHHHHKHEDKKDVEKKPDDKKSFVQLKDFDDDDDKEIMESIKYAENKIGAKMGTPKAIAKEAWAPTKYDVEDVTDLKLVQKDKKLMKDAYNDKVEGLCEVDDDECRRNSKAAAPTDEQKV